MGEDNSFDETVLADLVCLAFDHQDRIGCAGDDDVHRALEELVTRRIHDEFAVEFADAYRSDRPVPGDIRKRERCRRTDHRKDVGLVLLVGREHGGNDLNFVTIAFGKSGRIGRSVSRAARMACSDGRPSRRKNPPGIFLPRTFSLRIPP